MGGTRGERDEARDRDETVHKRKETEIAHGRVKGPHATEKNDARVREMETLTTAAVSWPDSGVGRTPRHRRYLSLRKGLVVVFLAEQKSMSFTDVLSRCF